MEKILLFLLVATIVPKIRGECTCSFEKTISNQYGCRLLKQSVIEESDMNVITGTHWQGYDDPNVTALWSDGSIIKIFPSAFSVKFPQLDYIHLKNANFKYFEKPIENCANLDWIAINDNNIPQLLKEIFAGCKKLRILSLMGNKIPKIDNGAFIGLSELVNLDLASNNLELSEMDKDVFEPVPKIKILNVNNNRIRNLPSEIFAPLLELSILSLMGNEISEIDEKWFEKIENLTELNLADNQLISINSEVFKNLKKLSTLTLSGNKIQSLPQFSGLAGLQTLNVNENSIKTVTPESFSYPSLLNLYMNKNDIVLVVNFLKFSSNLRFLEIGTNNLENIVENAFHSLKNLQTLSLFNNSLTNLKAESFSGLTNLNRMVLGYNRIDKIDEDFFETLPKLKWLDMRGNICSSEEIRVNDTKELKDFLLECTSSGNLNQFQILIPVALLILLWKFF